MIISTKKGTPQVELDRIVDNFEKQGLSVTLIRGTDYNVFGLVGDTTKIAEKDVLANPWVENVTRVSAPYKRANRLFHPEDTVVDINGVRVGGNAPIAVMAGPCSIEGEEHTIKMAKAVKAGGANFLRGGAYKPRTSPYSFQGLGTEGILDMVKAREITGLPIVSELMDEVHIPEFEEYVDVVQIGTLSSVSAASAHLSARPATRWTCPPCRSSRKKRTCPLSLTPATPPVIISTSRAWLWLLWPPVPTVWRSRSTTTRRTPGATVPSA